MEHAIVVERPRRVRNVFSCFDEVSRCQITGLQKRARYVKKKTFSKSVRAAMCFDSSTIVQFYQGSLLLGKDKILSEYEHSRPKHLIEMEQQVNKFMFEFDRLTALRCKQYKENTPHHMRGWIQTKGEDVFKRFITRLNFCKRSIVYQLNNNKDFFAIKKITCDVTEK
ncbi:hypothetical protein RFI_31251 [Reticulomyxa filosa]|uniref:Uncharacterized protein n=1 Tax=Reticulomyxa filosa TaxID=46433 RepID=X6LXP5_RETFI|nr:hypothetical protein RFI_31251 [Reticulomyxa filosa]|eukprot:ETO06146.1 hypothetical protein RFI_31251 [Reticulomyxa filosa]